MSWNNYSKIQCEPQTSSIFGTLLVENFFSTGRAKVRDNVFSNGNILLNQFVKYFNKPSNNFALLLMDRHSSRFNLSLATKTRQNNIFILLSPSNATHFVQPLDLTVFSSLKISFYQGVRNFNREDPYSMITTYDIARLVCPNLQPKKKNFFVNKIHKIKK